MNKITSCFFIAVFGFAQETYAQFDQNATYSAYIINQTFLSQLYSTSGTGWDRGSIGQNLRWSPILNKWEGAWSGGSKDFALIRFGNGGSINFYNNTGSSFSNAPFSLSNDQLNQYLAMSVDVNGRLGVGTAAPMEKLDVNGNINVPIGKTIGYLVNAGQGFTYDNNTLGAYSIGWAFDNWADGRGNGGPTGNFSGWGGLKFFTANQPRLAIDNSGNVGIGNTSPDAMLTVSGLVHAQEVKVTVHAPGPDYVFEKNYKLTSLEEIKNYIDQNKHLPEVPSAKDMEKNGVQLGEMNMLLLKKIEELTLYVIDANKKIDLQQERISQQQKEIELLKMK
jgi:hypothetical protein